jgi:leader peptidase (prepilin peptidase)/N-methyltransferase
MGFIQIAAGAVHTVPFARLWENDAAIVTTLFFFTALLYASVQDIKRREVFDCVHIIIAVTAFIGFERSNLPAMLFGAAAAALPLFIAGVAKKGSIGGADIKLMAASGLLLGAGRGVLALVAALTFGLACTLVPRLITKATLTESFPLVPYLALGCALAYLL